MGQKKVEELAEEGDEESAIRLCHASEDVAEQISELCAGTFGWDICEEAEIFDFGEDTGCRSNAPTAREGFAVGGRVDPLRACGARKWGVFLWRWRGVPRVCSVCLAALWPPQKEERDRRRADGVCCLCDRVVRGCHGM